MIGIYIFIGMLVAYYVSGLFIKIFICWPISAYWKGETDKCLNQSAIIFADTIISAISDLVILLLPTPLTWSLQLSRRKRLRVIGILCAGGVATAFSIYRLAMILHEGNNAEAGIGFNMRLSSIYKRSPSSTHSTHEDVSRRGEIVMTRSFHVDAGRTGKERSGQPKEQLFESKKVRIYWLSHSTALFRLISTAVMHMTKSDIRIEDGYSVDYEIGPHGVITSGVNTETETNKGQRLSRRRAHKRPYYSI
ncbi:uncharacterized protein FOBCDRAFT_204078 [Fusarium oxysporum Fo47]|uniref:uncharacterized protein n=1 Tax=Fusarium oxysporum Fo47 TaxID=660027 RepID=UPI0028698E86|nr:uncharacterized protein FOBCDRAFT_204078 [Fusarium oxysporum Fo47]QKD57065.2 hypothetical protein FOBCDRAFT_204078 [Fusarium oxysporum Fo47]